MPPNLLATVPLALPPPRMKPLQPGSRSDRILTALMPLYNSLTLIPPTAVYYLTNQRRPMIQLSMSLLLLATRAKYGWPSLNMYSRTTRSMGVCMLRIIISLHRQWVTALTSAHPPLSYASANHQKLVLGINTGGITMFSSRLGLVLTPWILVEEKTCEVRVFYIFKFIKLNRKILQSKCCYNFCGLRCWIVFGKTTQRSRQLRLRLHQG